MILTQQRTVKMKKKIIKMCANNGRQHLKQLLNRERCSWKMWAVKKKKKKRMRHHSRRIPAAMKIF
ncbi:nuclear casein kinase and cyclin dependent kinase substrate 1 [Rhinolophus ferrumequinum]|uniref:Nuclear casein kinase and cyclin dependent kinase substrate 1 n=1 Tax=Rhinolophus ferrumequinum TaxID=59479 RepID=A0A7J7SZ41_RHIFE|nr:nuclear casein kinase and cyclin dependent kinase substrate 1 [Rhinolophus ferrumequinum]